MSKAATLQVKALSLDLANFRTVEQQTEAMALEAMISTSPDRFWALADSLLSDGYLPTESIIVLRTSSARGGLVVKEGNRRVAALKMMQGLLARDGLNMPENIAAKIAALSDEWLRGNAKVPCTVYEKREASTVDRIVRLAHGKGEKAGRDQWNAVARARHNRDANAASEPALDLLERYLTKGKNVTAHQRAQWAGNYPLSVLAEAMKKLHPRLGLASSAAMAGAYPSLKYRDSVEGIIHAIGTESLDFHGIREKATDFALRFGLPSPGAKGEKPATGGTGGAKSPGSKGAGGTSSATSRKRSLATSDPKAVRTLLREFKPMGKNRGKVVALCGEAQHLKLKDTPLAFCFVLRSMFEISAKAYCGDHSGPSGPSHKKKDGSDKSLVDVLREITTHLTKNKSDKDKLKLLHGAMTELAKSDGLLSVTSMNQLVHNPRFSVAPGDVAILFSNVFPLLEEMNA